jgi:hypothetical protein
VSRGIVVFAQNSLDNYVLQACVLAMSLKISKNTTPISIITNDAVPTEYASLFDKIIPIPWGDMSAGRAWKVENRWKIFHATPYKETIVLDSDMLALDDIDYLWDFYKKYDLFFTTQVKTYRNEIVNDTFYRKVFVDNKLPNIYTGLHYFKKNEFAHNFYAYLEMVIKNWKQFYEQLNEKSKPEQLSIDVAAAITAKMMNCTESITNNLSTVSTFVHMKPRIQNWTAIGDSWQNKVSPFVTKACEIKIGNNKQSGIFHYTENSFISNTDIVEKFRKVLDV